MAKNMQANADKARRAVIVRYCLIITLLNCCKLHKMPLFKGINLLCSILTKRTKNYIIKVANRILRVCLVGHYAHLRKDLNMICTKCNSEVPNGAKFCPVCGNACGTASDVKPIAAPPEPEKKTFCGKCGLELRQGAKFCSVCGAPAAGIGNIKPIQNDGATFGSGAMSAVSLDKPISSDNPVAAMSTAPAPSSFVPTPSNDVPRPSNDTGFSSGFGTGYSAPAFIPESPVTPAAPFGNTNDNPFGDMGAAAIVATPIKKKSGAKVGIIIAAVLVVLVAAAAIFFFTNKATALSLIMGKPGYATMVEGNSIKAATEKLDLPAVSNSIKSVSSLVSTLATVDNDYALDDAFDALGMSNTTSLDLYAYPSAAPMMAISSADGPFVSDGAVDMEAVITSYYELMMNTYGVNSVNATLNMDIDLSDSIKNMLGSETDEILELLNGITFTTNVSSAEDKLSASMGVESGSSVIDAKVVFTEDGDVYVVFPFISEQGLKVKIPTTTTSAPRTEIKPLEIDEKELERLIGELVEIYLNAYKESAIEMEQGELSAAGLTATGKLITAEFSGSDLSDLLKDLAKHFANDEYFTTKFVDFANECGADITKEEYREAILDELDDFEASSSDKLIISTIIDNNGNILAKSFKAVYDDDNVKLTYVDSKEQFTLEISENGMTVISLVQDITSEKDGAVTVKCTDGDDGSFTIKMTYADADTAKFCGNDTIVGKYTLGVELPADFTEDVPEEIGNLSNIKFTYSTAVSGGNTMECSIGVEAGNLGSVSLNSKMTAENGSVSVPSDVIDLGDMESEPDEATMKKLEEYLKTAVEKLGALDGVFGDLVEESGILDGVNMLGGSGSTGTTGSTGNSVSINDILYLTQEISDIQSDVEACRVMYGTDNASLESRAMALITDINKLVGEISPKVGNMTPEEFKSFQNRVNSLRAQADTLKREYEKMPPSSTSTSTPNTPASQSGGTTAETINFDSMDIETLVDTLTDYDDRFLTLIEDDAVWDRVFDDPAIEALYDDCEAAYDKVSSDFDLYTYNMSNLQSLRNLRKSVKAYAIAIEKFEKALQISI
ncbi:MAG: zinc ribbon domain-containing protein [Ruminococcaceae bacterium]|nr:zinc ribbon domain-containing protein [Oscillospiraceae bacterium]